MRRMESPSPDLAERIILAARQVPQLEAVSLGTWLSRLFGEFLLPRPAVVAAVVLVIGVLAGVGIPGVAEESEPLPNQAFLYDEGALL